MPYRPPRVCIEAGCNLTSVGGSHRCERHRLAAEEKRAEQRKIAHLKYNERRDESDSFYKTERWKKLSAYYRKKHPVCEHCENAASDITDHIKPYKSHPDLGLDWDNLRALCRACHNRVGEKVGLVGSQNRV